MRKFEISLCEWLNVLKADEGKTATVKEKKHKTAVPERRSPRLSKLEESSENPGSSGSLSSTLQLNFIQVARNYFQTHAWFSQQYLKYMYDSAIACYVYPNCPAWDLVFPIRNKEEYHPALVSIKCWDAIGTDDMRLALSDMAQYVKGYRCADSPTALCILIVIGSQKVKDPPSDCGNFPSQDAYFTVVVSRQDKFRVLEAIVNSATALARAKILTSHLFAHVEDLEYNALRMTAKEGDQKFGEALIEDKRAKST